MQQTKISSSFEQAFSRQLLIAERRRVTALAFLLLGALLGNLLTPLLVGDKLQQLGLDLLGHPPLVLGSLLALAYQLAAYYALSYAIRLSAAHRHAVGRAQPWEELERAKPEKDNP